MPIYVLTIVVG